MSLDQQYMRPDEQKRAFFDAFLNHLTSTDKGQSQTVEDPQAQQGVSPIANPQDPADDAANTVDYSKIQSLFRDATSGHPVVLQDGDKMHPMDAIQQITQKLATGPQIQQNAPAGGFLPRLLGQKQPGLSVSSPSQGLIPRLLGNRDVQPISGENFFNAAKEAGILKYLPNGLAKMPDGTPLVPMDAFTKALEARKATQNPNNPPVPLKDALALGQIGQKQYDAMIKNGHTPEEMMPLTEMRASASGRMAGAREEMVNLGWSNLKQKQIDDVVNGISDAQQKPGSALGVQANKLNAVIHARSLFSQAFDPTTGKYDMPKAMSSEAMLSLASAVSAGGGGQVTDTLREELSSPNLYQRAAGIVQYLTGQPVNAQTPGLLDMYRNALDRQGVVSQDLFNNAAARELPKGYLLQKSDPVAYAYAVSKSFGTHNYRDFVANQPDASVSQVPGPTQLGGNGDIPKTSPSYIPPAGQAAPSAQQPTSKVSPNDLAALKWIQDNPLAPEAAKIKQTLRGKGLIK